MINKISKIFIKYLYLTIDEFNDDKKSKAFLSRHISFNIILSKKVHFTLIL